MLFQVFFHTIQLLGTQRHAHFLEKIENLEVTNKNIEEIYFDLSLSSDIWLLRSYRAFPWFKYQSYANYCHI